MRPFPTGSSLSLLTSAALLALAGCSGNSSTAQSQASSTQPSGKTLAQAIAGTDNLSTVADELRATGLSQVFDGAGTYTILAPTDAAFAKLGDAGVALKKPDNRSEMAAVLRDHIVPGYLTTADIESAIDAQHGAARVQTMGDHQLRFTRAGDGLKVTNEDGSEAMIAGDALMAGNGVAIPIDGVLKKLSHSG